MLRLLILQGPDKGRLVEIRKESVLLGRDSPDLRLRDNTISRRHARLFLQDGRWFIEDLKSSNGTSLNGLRVSRPAMVKPGDQIRVGSSLMVFRSGNEPPTVVAQEDNAGIIKLDGLMAMSDDDILARRVASEESVIIAVPESLAALGNLRVLYRLSAAISSIFSIPQLLDQVLGILFETLPIERGFVLLYDPPTSDELVPLAHRIRAEDKPRKITAPKAVIQRVLDSREGLLLTNVQSDQRFGTERTLRELGIRTMICVPVAARETLLGAIYIDSTQEGALNESQLQLVTAIGLQTGLAIENARLFDVSLKAERLNATGETVAYLSHYIKNILQGLRGGADVVNLGLDRAELDLIRQGWQIVGKNVDKIYSLMVNMLAFSKDREPRLELVQVNSVVQDVLELAGDRSRTKGILLVDVLGDDMPPIPADATGLHHALLNIVSNAIDACPDSGGVVTLCSRYNADLRRVELAVADNGPGIPTIKQEEIFTPFVSTKGQGGTGLGLAVARKLVQEHGGQIAVRSIVGEGSEFTVLLPIRSEGPGRLDDTSGPGVRAA